MIRTAVTTGVASTTRRDVDSVDHVNGGRRNIVIPGARMRRMVTMKLIAPRMEAVPTVRSPRIHRSCPTPPCTDSGT